MSRMIRLRISSEADAARAVMEASRFARALGFSSSGERAIATAVSELARNILKYAGTGEVLIDSVKGEKRLGMQVTVRDRGPGIEDLDQAMLDHFSSGGTLGLGLPGVRRMMDDFEIQSTGGEGTVVVIRKWRAHQPRTPRLRVTEAVSKMAPPRQVEPVQSSSLPDDRETPIGEFDSSYFVRPCRGERLSGDAAIVRRKGDNVLLGVIDGLGHGPDAFRVAKKAVDCLAESWRPDAVALLSRLHRELKGTIGAVAGIGILDLESHLLKYAGVGNTAARVLGSSRFMRLGSTEGTLGHQMRTPKEYCVELADQELVILHTDGVTEKFEMADYPQMRFHKAKTISGNIIRRFGKDHDDATCIVLRYAR